MTVTRALRMLPARHDDAGTDVGAAATPSPGCGKTLASGVYQMMDQNVTRTYRVFVPSDYQPGIPHIRCDGFPRLGR
jgi:hypothetical protein